MGCSASKSIQVSSNTNNSTVVKQGQQGPLTSRQIELVQESWKCVEPDMRAYGIVFYTRLFKQYPDVLQLFSFRDLTDGVDNLAADPRAVNQAERTFKTVDVAVKNLNNLPAVVPILKELGARHAGYKVQDDHYGPVGESLVYTLETGLGDKFTAETREAWLIVYGIVADTMKAGAKEVQQMNGES